MTVIDVTINGSKLPIQEFKLSSMVRHASILMIAKRGSGKSWICRSILKHFRDIPVGMIIAPTDRMNTFYGKFFPESFIHYEYKSEIIKKLLNRQKEMIDKRKEKRLKGKKIDPRAFIVMDDCLSQKGQWLRDKPILELLFEGRHYKVMYILTMQDPLGITPQLRGNFDYIFLLAEDFQSNLKRIYDHYAGMFPTFDSFRQVFGQLTADFGAMVVVNRGARKTFLEKIFQYKAPNQQVKQIGCNQFNRFHERNFDKNWKMRHKDFDAAEYFMDKKKDKTSVKIGIVKKD